ncbi:DUF349 domain-containing protein [Enemella evansiae]|uniref:DNA repair protein n=1 Tax=Enemella evansiae TaxID=2016499 RepID=A0A255GJY3_9ACTN|nr:DUF349 domain-containing protein [Enemella evansiae]OYN98410.1 DNA repair protein [Enemella evansiae]OYO15658.1 DNA repair protein [Enemella evansiae]OYO15891.1 DNA repair protein [Enemella evansiae]OYO20644.1 DNA repair protein [Enemella evansiae]TDO93217.1 uncharacterized protein DUF349 [Enemella evansiae]
MSEAAGPASFGRVDDDGTVYVRTSDGERAVGQVPDVSGDEALAFYVRRFQSLEVEVDLLASRVRAGTMSPDDARKAVATLHESIPQANAVGDLAALDAKLEGLTGLIGEQAAARKVEKAQQNEQTKATKEKMVAEAEKLAAGNDWRGGVNRFRALLDEWKALPRIDRRTDDELWHRFSSARTQYTRRRKQQFAQQASKREEARAVKEQIIAEAEPLASSTEWGPTAGAFRELMQRWKAAGSAPRDVDEQLWQRFRGIQDQFFAARSAAMSEQDAEFRGNQEAKEALLVEAEQTVVPVKDLAASKAAYRDFLEKYAEIGKVPRDAIRPLDNRVRALESAIREAEDEQWRRTNPEARQRASDTAIKLQAQIDQLEDKAAKAETRGDARKAKEHRDAAETYRTWLEQAEKAVEDFSG